jgi:hypothetical protein
MGDSYQEEVGGQQCFCLYERCTYILLSRECESWGRSEELIDAWLRYDHGNSSKQWFTTHVSFI